ncbi:hypothetical protein [Flavobacterium sp. 140616W15]|uniref:hypothetical protein n=1 Tax=Flavobacterium sp. 140616W15 TaxID=2478552 RepID=UPI0013EDD2FC|nr:hypothetical protein [Flavobacterium sp. 140616W15]
MNEDQAQTMIELLVEISNKLTDISKKISSEYEVYDISEKIDKVVSSVDDVVRNTSNLS